MKNTRTAPPYGLALLKRSILALFCRSVPNRAYPAYTIGFPRPGNWHVRFNSDWSGYDGSFTNQSSYDTAADVDGMDHLPCHGDVGIGPYTAIILSQ